MSPKPETEAQRAEAVRRAQLHTDRGQAVGGDPKGCKQATVGVFLFLFSLGCILAEGAAVMAEHNILY